MTKSKTAEKGAAVGLTTHFAPPERADEEDLHKQVTATANSPVMTALLETFGSLLAILNEQRQIVAINRPLLTRLGIDQGQLLHGMRPGEALGCVFVEEAPAGCGTGKACRTCGSIIAILGAIKHQRPEERECILSTERNGSPETTEFKIRATPVEVDGNRLLVLSMEDISREKRREALERIFFHDVLNEVNTLTGYAEVLEFCDDETAREYRPAMRRLVWRLARELQAQRDFSTLDAGDYEPRPEALCTADLWEMLSDTFAEHSVSTDRTFILAPLDDDRTFSADRALLERVLENMAKNALEATARGGEVRMRCEAGEESLRFVCWNAGKIPHEVAQRIFHRSFSTKGGNGRGLGTYSMRLLGERYLGGRVGFTSTEADGTEFFLELPRRPAVAA